MKTTFFYDLLFMGGIETSCIDLLKYLIKKYNIDFVHRSQYFTQQKTVKKIEEVINKPIMDTEKENIETDIFIFATMIFDYKTIFSKLKSKINIGWLHFIPDEQCVFENMLLYKEYTDKIDYWICVSEECKRGLLKLVPNAKVEVIHNTINTDRIKRLSEVPIGLQKEKQISFVTSSRLSVEKGMEEAIEFISKVHDSGISYVWYLIGAGVDPDTLDHINEARKKYNIVTPGYLDNPYNVIAKCDYGLMLSPKESWSIFIDECHVLGVPTITRDWKALHERKNIEDYNIIIDDDISKVDIEKIIKENARLKDNLRTKYKFTEEYHKWDEFLNKISKEIK